MNLVSSESDESDDGAEDIDHECCRGGLYVAQTRGLQPAAAALIYVFCCRYKMHVSGCVGRAAASEANRREEVSKPQVGKVG